jgi:hypothetical protein
MKHLLDTLDQGYALAQAGVGRHDALQPEELGIGVVYALLDLVLARVGEVSEVRRQAREGKANRWVLRAIVEEDLAELLEYAHRAEHPLAAPWLEDAEAQSRLVDITLDTLFSESYAPELRLPEGPLSLADLPVHGLIFSAFPNITNELYPLMVDAFVADLEAAGTQQVQVVGIHQDWLDGNRVRRAIVYDPDRQLLLESAIAGAPRLASAQVLALRLPSERDDHHAITAALAGVPLLNPPDGAAVLDDKVCTAEIWRDAGLDVPTGQTFAPGRDNRHVRDKLAAFIAAHGTRIVLKPLDSTEGQGVGLFDFARPDGRAAALRHLEQLRGEGSVLLMPERGCVRYAGAGGPRRCAVRLNVCWDGAEAWPQSGCAQVARDGDSVASAGQGGGVIPLPELWRHLCREDGKPLHPTREDWHRLLETAHHGARALGKALGEDMPALVGLDLLLDIAPTGEIVPVLLEANPRPAGMGHARFVLADGPSDEPGVSLILWEVVRGRQSAPAK